MLITDFHAHIYPEKIAGKAVKSVSEFYGINVQNDGTPEMLLAQGKKAGISRFVVHSVAVVPQYVHSINDFIAAQMRIHPEFVGFGTLHPEMADPLSELARIGELGLRGVKLHPDTQRFNMDDPGLFEIYDAMQDRFPLLIHCGDYRYDYSHPRRLANLLDRFPRLVVVGAHFGGWSVFDLALEHLLHRACYLDVSSSIMMLGKQRAAELIRKYGAKRIIFGTDFPMWNPASELAVFDSLPLTDGEKECILSTNAADILGD